MEAERAIYEVYAKIVDANGTYSTLSGYPKAFDSKNYDNDIEKTYKRAVGEFHSTFGEMCKRDDRQLQAVILMTAAGVVLDQQKIGKMELIQIPENVDE